MSIHPEDVRNLRPWRTETPRYTPVTVDKATLDAAKLAPLLIDEMRKQVDKEIVRHWVDLAAHPFNTPVGDIMIRSRPDPLDVKYDGVPLRDLLAADQALRRETYGRAGYPWSAQQRAAIAAHWSAELRAKVAASADRDRHQVRVDLQDEP